MREIEFQSNSQMKHELPVAEFSWQPSNILIDTGGPAPTAAATEQPLCKGQPSPPPPPCPGGENICGPLKKKERIAWTVGSFNDFPPMWLTSWKFCMLFLQSHYDMLYSCTVGFEEAVCIQSFHYPSQPSKNREAYSSCSLLFKWS